MIDLLIRHVTAITVDRDRRVINDAAIGVTNDRIVAIGSDADLAETPATKVIDASGMAAIPGLIDSHAHAGHGLVRALGAGDVNKWFHACEEIYARGSTIAFWQAEARLAQLERLKAGVTTSVTLLGGGADIYRTDDAAFGDAHCDVTQQSGLRTILAVGPGRAPFPKFYRRIEPGNNVDFDLTFGRQMRVSEDLIKRRNNILQNRTGICLIMPVYSSQNLADDNFAQSIPAMSEAVSDLRARYAVLFTQDGHRSGSIAVAKKLGLLGSFAMLSHSVDLTADDFDALAETGASIVHNPSAIMSIYGRCPVPELIDHGVRVCLGSDAGAPDRGVDMFRHMANCMHYHRRHFRDPAVMPPGKVFEMATIDAANAMGLGADLGSLEVGKKADIVLVDLRKPHLYPANMPLNRLAHFANAADVDTVIVDGRILMQGRNVLTFNEAFVLDDANAEILRALERTGLMDLLEEPQDLWRKSKVERGN